MPRPAVRTVASPDAYVAKLHKKAVQLEEQLATTASDSTAADKLRLPLCEALSDLILTDPAFSRDHSVPERLWRGCFYSKIAVLRAFVSKQRRKALKQQQQLVPSNNSSSKKTTSSSLDQAQNALYVFLQEAVDLYHFLFLKLQAKLEGPTAAATRNNNNTSSTVASSTIASAKSAGTWSEDDDATSNNTSTAGVVDCMHLLALQFGDLYRYWEKLTQAQAYYLKAAHLAPGHGHAMNQLAVVLSSPPPPTTSSSGHAQKQNHKNPNEDPAAGQRAVALFWYARSLSVPKPFSTARGNLARLWDSNQAWLQQHEQTSATTAADNKSQQSRLFLAHFCQLHHFLFDGLTQQRLVELQVYDKMRAFIQSLVTMLQMSALGDSLLCKMVTIQAFSECFCDHSILKQEPPTSDYKKAVVGASAAAVTEHVPQTTSLAARTLTLWFGHALAQRVGAAVADDHTPPGKKKAASLRLLLPLLLLCEYVSTTLLPASFLEGGADWQQQEHEQAAVAFWKCIVQVLNQLQTVATAHMNLPLPQLETVAKQASQSLREYQDLRGFGPFDSFLPPIPANGVLVEHEALLVLQDRHNNNHAQQQRSSKQGGKSQQESSSSSVVMVLSHSVAAAASSTASIATTNVATTALYEQNVLKVARFLWWGQQLAAQQIRYNEQSQQYEWDDSSSLLNDQDETHEQQKQQEENQDDAMEDVNNMAFLDDDNDDQRPPVVPTSPVPRHVVPPTAAAAASTMLVYQQPEGGGPALLVPAVGLLQPTPRNNTTPLNSIAPLARNHTAEPMLMVVQPQQETTATPMDIALPPVIGLNVPAAVPMNTHLPTNNTLMPPPGFCGFPQSDPPPRKSEISRFLQLFPRSFAAEEQEQQPVVAQSFDLFGDLHTANPFAVNNTNNEPSMRSNNNHNLFTGLTRDPRDVFLQDDMEGMDGTPLLDSSLLSSLLMDDSPNSSKNPFAT